MSREAAAALLAVLLLPAAARAAPPMTSGANTISQYVANAGGAIMTSGATATKNTLTSSVNEAVAVTTNTSGAAAPHNVLRVGFSEIAYTPGTLTSLAPNSGDVSHSSVTTSSGTLNWATPGEDGGVGTLQSGSAYLIQVASAAFTGIFADVNAVSLTVSTHGVVLGNGVGSAVTGLDSNTTFFAQVWTRDDDGNLSGPFVTTFTTLAQPPVFGALEFSSISWSSVTVQWAAPFQQGVSSQTNEGYVLNASSNNFGALPPAGAPVISSMSFNVQSTTLTVGAGAVPLDLSNTYYFQLGSLNWVGQPNYTVAAPTRLNFQITQSTGLVKTGFLDPSVALSTIATSSMVITNVGNWPATILLAASTATLPSSPWALSTSSGPDVVALLGVFFTGALGPPAVGPPAVDFNTYLTTTARISQNAGNYSSASENGYQLLPGHSVTMWFRFFLPITTTSGGSEKLLVTSQPVYP